MAIAVGGFAKTIFDQIELLYLDHVGPIAAIIVQEALETWAADLKSQNLKPSLRNISGYLTLLAKEISDESDQKKFITSVFEIQALSHYKQLYKGISDEN